MILSACDVLYFLAHPDDEIGIILRIREDIDKGRMPLIVFVTSGKKDEFHHRPAESRRALVKLGLRNDQLEYWHEVSPLVKTSGDPTALISRAAQLIDKTTPKEIFVPAYEGGSSDHDLMPFLLSRALKQATHKPMAYEYPLYNFRGKRLRVFELIPGPGKIVTEPITDEHLDFWDMLPSYYPSQKRYLNIYRRMLKRDILKARGLQYRVLPDHDYAKKPHRGTLLYMIRRPRLRKRFEKMVKIS